MSGTRIMPMDAIQAHMQAAFSAGAPFRMNVTGNSMRPFLYPLRDAVELSALMDQPVRNGEIVLVRQESGRWLLHRVMKINGDEVTTAGDGNIYFDEAVRLSEVVARVDALILNGKRIPVANPLYRILSFCWRHLYVLRPMGFKAWCCLKRCLRTNTKAQ